MFTRDALVAEQNTLVARAAELRAVEGSTDELTEVVARLASIKAELDVITSREVPAVVEAASEGIESLGARAAKVLAGAPVGTSTTVSTRTIIAGTGEDQSGDFTWPQQVGFVAQPDAPTRFIDTLPTAVATSDAVTYVKEAGFENAAAARLAGDPAAESNLTFEKVSLPIANVAHFIRIAEENLSDASYIGSVIDRRGVGGVRSKINAQLLAESDTTNGVKSVVAAAGSNATYAEAGATNLLDAIYAEKMAMVDMGLNPSHVGLSSAAAQAIATAKVNGSYLGNGPFGGPNGTIWGLIPVVDNFGHEAVVYDSSVITLHVRDEANVATDRDIVSNLYTVRVQTRAQVSVEIPEGVVTIDLEAGE